MSTVTKCTRISPIVYHSNFLHRLPSESAQALAVEGSTAVSEVKFEGFDFKYSSGGQGWGGAPAFDYGHSGYTGYGSSGYNPPQFNSNDLHHDQYRHY